MVGNRFGHVLSINMNSQTTKIPEKLFQSITVHNCS